MSTGETSSETKKRPWLAALLSILWPGLGHAYLRAWARALLWLLMLVLTSVVLVPPSITPSSVSVEAFMQAYRQIPTSVSLVVFALTILCALDAYRLARERNRERATATAGRFQSATSDESGQLTTCPNCGKELDEDLDFCPWCSYELADNSSSADE